MVAWLSRSAWGARPPTNSSALIASEVDGTGIHYPGMGSRKLVTQAQVASALRGWQDYHMDDRGWSDIAYQAAVDQAGRKWALRGLKIRSGANGDSDVNHRYGAILLVIGDDEPLSEALKATTREVVAEFRRYYPKGVLIRPHSAIRPDPTSCPGDRARAAIARGELDPAHSTEDDVTPEQMAQILGAVNGAKAAADKATAAANAAKDAAAAAGSQAAAAADAAGRRWALYQLRFGLQTEDDRAAALQAYQDAIAKGDSQEQAMAAATAKLQALDDMLEAVQQGKG